MRHYELKKRFYEYLRENNFWWSPERLNYSLGLLFREFTLENKTILEVGAGHGLFSIWCAAHGGRRVVALEPEVNGATTNIRRQFEFVAKAVDLNEKVEYIGITLQNYLDTKTSENFDYILMNAVINHLDEEATKKLHLPKEGQSGRERYVKIFKSLYEMLNPKGALVIYDVGRLNFWSQIKIQNPFAPTIEYEKHQQPHIWKQLLLRSGFDFLDCVWVPPFKLRHFRFLFSSAGGAYLTNSGFVLRVKKNKVF